MTGTKRLSPLAAAVRDRLESCPDGPWWPSWIANYLWSEGKVIGKPTPEEVEAAIDELGGAAYLDGLMVRAS